MSIDIDWNEVYDGVRSDVHSDPDDVDTNYRRAVGRVIEAIESDDPATAEILLRLHEAFWEAHG